MEKLDIEQLILITSSAKVPDEAVLLNHMFAEGLSLLHLRKPEHTPEEVQRLLGKIKPEYYDRIVLPFSLVQDKRQLLPEGRKIHFFEQLRERTKAGYFETLQARGYTLSTSIHEAATIDMLQPSFAYTFLGPVFDSISKPGYAAMDKTQLDILQQPRKIRVIALGGITADNCAEALGYGFDGVAVLGVVWESNDPVQTFKQIQQCLTKGR